MDCNLLPLPCQRQQLPFICLFLLQIKFDFIPQHLDFTKSSWAFTIPEQNVSVPFLLAGNATEPLVTLDRSHLNFQLLLIGEHCGSTSHAQMGSAPGAQHSRYSRGSNKEAGKGNRRL